LLRLYQAPKPNVRIEEEFQFLSASMIPISTTGETISPTISMLPDIDPIQLRSSVSGAAGIISAIAFPHRVTLSGSFVLLTADVLFAVATPRSYLMLLKTKFPTPLYKNPGERRADDGVLPVCLRLEFAAPVRHERRNNEVL
jgi:hypothetical protein